jgi:hypothetical protein
LDASVTEKHFKQPSETFSIYDAGVPLMEPDTSTPLKKAIIDVENGIRNNELETGAAFNSDGVILFKRQGLPDRVTLTDHELSLLNNAVLVTITLKACLFLLLIFVWRLHITSRKYAR